MKLFPERDLQTRKPALSFESDPMSTDLSQFPTVLN